MTTNACVYMRGGTQTLLAGMQTSTATLEINLEVSQKLQIVLPQDTALSLLSI